MHMQTHACVHSTHMHTHESILSAQARLLTVTHDSMLSLETLPCLAAGTPSLLSSFTVREASVQGLSSIINPSNTRASSPSLNNSSPWHCHTTHLSPESYGAGLFYLIFPIRLWIPCGFLSVTPASYPSPDGLTVRAPTLPVPWKSGIQVPSALC